MGQKVKIADDKIEFEGESHLEVLKSLVKETKKFYLNWEIELGW